MKKHRKKLFMRHNLLIQTASKRICFTTSALQVAANHNTRNEDTVQTAFHSKFALGSDSWATGSYGVFLLSHFFTSFLHKLFRFNAQNSPKFLNPLPKAKHRCEQNSCLPSK